MIVFAAFLSKTIHKPSKTLLSISCKIKGSILSLLRLEHFIYAWHSKNIYGLLYGMFGLIFETKYFKTNAINFKLYLNNLGKYGLISLQAFYKVMKY